MRHLTLTLSLILGLATSVSAAVSSYEIGDVLFCHMTDFLEWEPEESQFHRREKEKFKFSIVDEKTVKFGSATSVFSTRSFSMGYWSSNGNPNIRGHSSHSSFILTSRGKFNYVSSGMEPIVIMATCDRF